MTISYKIRIGSLLLFLLKSNYLMSVLCAYWFRSRSDVLECYNNNLYNYFY